MRATLSRVPASGWMALLALVLYAAFASWLSDFRTTVTIANILANSATDGLLAVALTVPLLAGEIDLSIGSNLALSGVIFTLLQTHNGTVVAALAALLAGIAMGVVNSWLVSYLRVNSFVATLAMLYLAQSLALQLAHGGTIAGTDIPLSLDLGKRFAGTFSIPFLMLAVITLIAVAFVTRTTQGRDLVAIGGNRDAAVLAGIRVNRRLYLAFIVSGAITAISGVQLAATTLSGAPTIGSSDLLVAASAVFLGGVSLTGGRGSALASALAVVALSTLEVGLQLAGISAGIQDLITGLILIAVVTARAVSARAQGKPVLPRYLAARGSRVPRSAAAGRREATDVQHAPEGGMR